MPTTTAVKYLTPNRYFDILLYYSTIEEITVPEEQLEFSVGKQFSPNLTQFGCNHHTFAKAMGIEDIPVPSTLNLSTRSLFTFSKFQTQTAVSASLPLSKSKAPS